MSCLAATDSLTTNAWRQSKACEASKWWDEDSNVYCHPTANFKGDSRWVFMRSIALSVKPHSGGLVGIRFRYAHFVLSRRPPSPRALIVWLLQVSS